uniref:MARVEL domain-containing protein n=1 Tax=Steinernema glaseri TaxID=37863 RepID=A0A1I8AKD6_9BILA
MNDEDVESGVQKNTSGFETNVQHAFLRKVFGIVLVQLLTTAGVCAAFRYLPQFDEALLEKTWFLLVNVVFVILLPFPLVALKKAVPINYILLQLFTLSYSFLVAHLAFRYDIESILRAFLMTIAVVVTLIIFTLQTDWEFDVLTGIACSLMSDLATAGMIQMICKTSPLFNLAVEIVTVFAFSLYLVIDVDNTRRCTDPENYIVAAVNLYLDIINIFTSILRLLGELLHDESDD